MNATRFTSVGDFIDYISQRKAGDGLDQIVKQQHDGGYMVRCASHRDDNPSLSVKEGDDLDGIVVHDFGGCDKDTILAAWGLTMANLYFDNGRPWGTSDRKWTLDEVHLEFQRYLGPEYDLEGLDVVLAVAACGRLPGDPPWLQVVGGSGAAKTETVATLRSIDAVVVSSISSEGALLSATSARERTKDATGGLLREIGKDGIIVVKDFTSILSMSRDDRAKVLAALREVYDGAWTRKVGVDGGRSLAWRGRIVLIGAVTTAWDAAHAVVSAMGDRFLLVRLNSWEGRDRAARQAIRNSGTEDKMRRDLAEAVHGLLSHIDVRRAENPSDRMVEGLSRLADLVTLARTAVERDYKGDVIEAHAPEMPTRLAKQLTQVYRGARLIGLDRAGAARLVTRVAHDTIPPLRLDVLLDVERNTGTTTPDVGLRLNRPRRTVDQALQQLQVLDLVKMDAVVNGKGKRKRTVWYWSVTDLVDKTVCANLRGTTGGNVTPSTQGHREGHESPAHGGTHVSPQDDPEPLFGSDLAERVIAVMPFQDEDGLVDQSPAFFVAQAEFYSGYLLDQCARMIDCCPRCTEPTSAIAADEFGVFLYVCDCCHLGWRCWFDELLIWGVA